jgi:diguanylate cyclase (GGDEF)-like protein
LILLDLDSFKEYNDTYGHLAGDEILRHAGQVINNSIRVGVDSGYRYGGDEFAIILIDADLDIAKEISERIKKAFIESESVTVSVGYAKFFNGMSPKELVATADAELYKSKEHREEKSNDPE